MDRALRGRPLLQSDFRVPQLATIDLSGQTIREVVPRGKHLLIRTDADWTVHTHFGMEGSWHLYRPGAPWRGGPGHDVRVVLTTDAYVAVGYRLSTVELLRTRDEVEAVGHLGPDILAADFDAEEAVRRMQAQPQRAVGEALLDQSCVAGLGNIYRCETLFVHGVNPWLATADVAGRLERMLATARELMQRSCATGEQRTIPGRGRRFHVFEQAGKPCLRCATRVTLGRLGEGTRQRLVYWCPHCQPGREGDL
jgi:endonuclease-8